MTPRHRIINAIKHKQPDKTPYNLDVTLGINDILAAYFGDADYLYTVCGNHIMREKHKNHVFLDDNSYRDLFGVVWDIDRKNGDIGIVREYLLKEPSIGGYKFPEPDRKMIGAKCENLVNNHSERFKIFEIGLSFFERAWTLRGMDNFLMDMLLEEGFVCELLDRITEFNLAVIDIASGYGIDCIMFGDDWGQQKGLIMGYPLWKKYIFPRMKVMYERIKKHGLYVAQHSCGDNRELFPDLIGIGLDIYNTFQPEIYDLREFKREYGGDVTIYGGISTQGVLSRGTPDEVYSAVRQTVEILGKNGGYIAAPTHQCTSDIPIDNILAFLKAVNP